MEQQEEKRITIATPMPTSLASYLSSIKLPSGTPLIRWRNTFFEAHYTAKLFGKRAFDIMKTDEWDDREKYLIEKYQVKRKDIVIVVNGGAPQVKAERLFALWF